MPVSMTGVVVAVSLESVALKAIRGVSVAMLAPG
jgi:hypothetical protein